MEELQKIIDWIDEYDKEHECFPHPNLIKMRMKLRVGELQSKVNVTLGSVSKCKPLPPEPPKDREIHISGESRHKR
mgnify:CR=1 FL=1